MASPVSFPLEITIISESVLPRVTPPFLVSDDGCSWVQKRPLSIQDPKERPPLLWSTQGICSGFPETLSLSTSSFFAWPCHLLLPSRWTNLQKHSLVRLLLG